MSKENALVAVSNISYFLVALWLFMNRYSYAWVIALVGTVSTVFHLLPNDKAAYYTDVVTANGSILWFLIVYGLNQKNHSRRYIAMSFATFVVAFLFYADSGCERQSSQYVWMHSVWHALTATALYFLVKSSDV